MVKFRADPVDGALLPFELTLRAYRQVQGDHDLGRFQEGEDFLAPVTAETLAPSPPSTGPDAPPKSRRTRRGRRGVPDTTLPARGRRRPRQHRLDECRVLNQARCRYHPGEVPILTCTVRNFWGLRLLKPVGYVAGQCFLLAVGSCCRCSLDRYKAPLEDMNGATGGST